MCHLIWFWTSHLAHWLDSQLWMRRLKLQKSIKSINTENSNNFSQFQNWLMNFRFVSKCYVCVSVSFWWIPILFSSNIYRILFLISHFSFFSLSRSFCRLYKYQRELTNHCVLFCLLKNSKLNYLNAGSEEDGWTVNCICPNIETLFFRKFCQTSAFKFNHFLFLNGTLTFMFGININAENNHRARVEKKNEVKLK